MYAPTTAATIGMIQTSWIRRRGGSSTASGISSIRHVRLPEDPRSNAGSKVIAADIVSTTTAPNATAPGPG